ncbi:hypothetical protein EP7_003193 [Isosphaeraceae bacterium EP7]
MERRGLQISVTAMLGLVAGVAINFWLFRQGFIYGFIGLNITKHVLIAGLCQLLGVGGGKDLGAKRRLHGPNLDLHPGRVGVGGSGGLAPRP